GLGTAGLAAAGADASIAAARFHGAVDDMVGALGKLVVALRHGLVSSWIGIVLSSSRTGEPGFAFRRHATKVAPPSPHR
ncbi:MAG: hypothetical protein JWO81_1176, partial [Alphaproteobacteria bacterium]|nr:hypothetical protein [Alphaproteobacteria bacterium]